MPRSSLLSVRSALRTFVRRAASAMPALALVAACTPSPAPELVPEPLAPTATTPEPTPPPTATVPEPPAPAAAGEGCSVGRDCASGICEGKGCGTGSGVCAPKQGRACTKDLAPFCSCEGKTFRASSTCPGQRFKSRGECPAGTAADGDPCNDGRDCASGICEGEGCGSNGGRCMTATRMCTRDLVGYCGCDGKSFQGSGTCPGKRFKARGLCPGDKLPFGK